jgi:hypothetical protein
MDIFLADKAEILLRKRQVGAWLTKKLSFEIGGKGNKSFLVMLIYRFVFVL